MTASGPFSNFPNVDRQLAVLEGELRLIVDGRPVELAAGGAPFSFPGDATTVSELLSERAVDLNLMTRRGRCDARLDQYSTAGPVMYAAVERLVIFSLTAGLRVSDETTEFELNAWDAAILSGRSKHRINIIHENPAEFFAVYFVDSDNQPIGQT
jgi:environmental stress-induced protein Ves